MKARQLFRYKERRHDLIVEMVIWELPGKTRERSHGLKYRLYCHYGDQEEPYTFASLDQLLDDFRRDCTDLAGWKWL